MEKMFARRNFKFLIFFKLNDVCKDLNLLASCDFSRDRLSQGACPRLDFSYKPHQQIQSLLNLDPEGYGMHL